MERTITVRGTGSYSAKPDIITVIMKLAARDKEYADAANVAEMQLTQIREALLPLGFGREKLKTVSFSVDTEYKSMRDTDGNYENVFNCYVVFHVLSLTFDCDTKMLGRVLAAVGESGSNPELHVSFGIADADAVRAALLEGAAQNARIKAEVLCKASGVKLGELLSVVYDWSELSLVSRAEYDMNDRMVYGAKCSAIDIEPDDVSVSDSVSFVWGIE